MTYLNCIFSGGLLIVLAAAIFWGLIVASIITAIFRKRTITHCLLAIGWAITLLACWRFTFWIQLQLAPSDVSLCALNLVSAHKVPMYHLVGSIGAVLLWIVIRPSTFAKPTTIALLVVLLFAVLFNFGANRAFDKWTEMISKEKQIEETNI